MASWGLDALLTGLAGRPVMAAQPVRCKHCKRAIGDSDGDLVFATIAVAAAGQ
jgi:hypothetical protein